MTSSETTDNLSRRQWLVRLFWTSVTAVTGGLIAPLLAYFFGPLFRPRTLPRVRLGNIDEFPEGRPSRAEFALRWRDGWVTVEGRQAAWIVRRGREIRVFDPRCTHLGCAYHWHEQDGTFLCPCHNGVYDTEGRVVGGPPPRPLDVYPTEVENGVLYAVPVPQRRS